MLPDTLKFPSGRTVKRLKQDAKALAKKEQIPLHVALDTVAEENGSLNGWKNAIKTLQKTYPVKSINTPKTNMNPYRKLVTLALNKAIESGKISLNWDNKERQESGYLITSIAGENTVINWSDASFGEIRISVWWNYDHNQHPQANMRAPYKECFQTSLPLAKRQRYKEFVGIVCSAWIERDSGRHIQGYGNESIFDRYTRKGELQKVKVLPNPEPLGFEIEGKFFM
ncbi:hypothetical protein [Thiomicrorhabdus sp.]|uniref:hypothetical protein n=1 Tax=Thiomicrorhabdus sp. TaxID=2039724 RepID=UPI002AA65463|nr:hypothetical protein [Thiomicrorhabdus sp.]